MEDKHDKAKLMMFETSGTFWDGPSNVKCGNQLGATCRGNYLQRTIIALILNNSIGDILKWTSPPLHLEESVMLILGDYQGKIDELCSPCLEPGQLVVWMHWLAGLSLTVATQNWFQH